MTNCRLIVNQKAYGGFKGISITKSLEAMSSVFSFEFSNMWDGANDPWPLNPQDLIEVELYGKTIIKGYIDILTGSLGPDSISYSVQGRDKTSDLIDCSCTPKSYATIGLLPLCKDVISGFPVSVSAASGIDTNQTLTNFTADPGETVHEVLDKISSKVGVLFIPDGKGDLLITKRGDQKAKVKLIEGVNAKGFSFTKDYSKRYSQYTVQGGNNRSEEVQKTGNWLTPPAGSKSSTASSPSSSVKDSGVTRFRPLYIRQSGNATASTVKEKAEWEANVRSAKSLEISCTVQGWAQDESTLWQMNQLVQVVAPRLGIGNAFGDEYLIYEIEYKLSDTGGEETSLRLLPKEAFLPDPFVEKKKRDQKGANWFNEANNSIQAYPGADSSSEGN